MQHHIQTKRSKVAYRTYGEKKNPPLMLVHGWPQSSYCWHEVAQYLKSYYIIAPDLRGLGDSERSLEQKILHKRRARERSFRLSRRFSHRSLLFGRT